MNTIIIHVSFQSQKTMEYFNSENKIELNYIQYALVLSSAMPLV